MSEAYKAAGVDLELSNDVSRWLYEAGKQTWVNRVGVYGEITSEQDSFSGYRRWTIEPLEDMRNPSAVCFDQDADGIGTKVVVSQQTSEYGTAAFDLMAMAADDSAARGFEPAVVTTVFDVNQLKDHMAPSVRKLAEGMFLAAKVANVAVKGGETAVLGRCVGGYGDPSKVLQYNWSATVHSIGHTDREISTAEIRPGDSLVAFQETGFRSNGLSLVRAALSKEFGRYWHTRPFEEVGMKLGQAVLQPSVIYTPILVDITGGYNDWRTPKAEIHGAAHITGGGIPEKVGRMLEATGYGAEISDPYELSELMKRVQTVGAVPDEEIYRVINGGQGMVVAGPNSEPLIAVAAEHGVEAKEVGVVTKRSGIRLRSAAALTPGKKLTYRAA
jgi:phosphoribosylformylglycinamidine cyclo-ligase